MTRGGSRPGSGPKRRLDGAVKVQLVLDVPTRKLLRELADDRVCSESEAARLAIAFYHRNTIGADVVEE